MLRLPGTSLRMHLEDIIFPRSDEHEAYRVHEADTRHKESLSHPVLKDKTRHTPYVK
jgi:hypothetical protein